MKELPKVLESKTKIRFQDCDPFNHLNNAAYLDYFMNAREDQVIDNYGIDVYKMAQKEGKSWVVGDNQISYLRPAFLMEDVVIESRLLNYDESRIKVELRMLNANKTETKAIMWSTFVHFNLVQQKKEVHSEDIMNLFESVVNPIEEEVFESRIALFRKRKL